MDKEKNDKLFQLGGYLLLNFLVEKHAVYDVFLENDDKYLDPILLHLLSQEYIKVVGSTYQVTMKGKEEYEKWMQHYQEWMPRLEVFSAVDLSAGEFAFARYYEFEDEQAWNDFLGQSRFQDLRVAVCQYHKLDSVEIVFMSFLNEGRWSDLTQTPGWQFDLSSGKLWEEIQSIIHHSIKIEDLGYEDDEGLVSGEAVISDIVMQGEELSLKLWEEEKKRKSKSSHSFKNSYQTDPGLDDAYRV